MSKLYEKKDYYVNYLKNKDVDLSDHLDITNLESNIKIDPQLFYDFAERILKIV